METLPRLKIEQGKGGKQVCRKTVETATEATRYPRVDPGCKSENSAENLSVSPRKSELLSADCSNTNHSEVRNGDALMRGGCSCSLEASAQLCRAKVSLSVQFILL